MKILHLLQSDRFSGAENVVCQIIGMLKDEPDIEMVYCSSDGQIREALAERGVRFIPLKNFSVPEIKKVLEKEKPDMVHAHDMRASFYAALSCGKIPLISHVHNNNFDSRGFSPKAIAYMYAAMKAKHIFWVSQSSFDGYAFHKLFTKKSSVLYNIIDIDKLYEKMNIDTNEYDYDIAYVGRLTYQKNPERLINVFRLVKDRMPNVKIAVIGTGDLEETAKELAKEYDLLNNVHFLGFQSNPLKLLKDCKMMVMTSRWEGTPMCAIEALALGVPVASTPTDGLKDLINDGENGFLSDDDSGLVEGILRLLSSEEEHMKMSCKAAELARSYNDIETYKEKILSIYKA